VSQSSSRLFALLAIGLAAAAAALIMTGRLPDLPGKGGASDTKALVERAMADNGPLDEMRSGKVHLDVSLSLQGVTPQLSSPGSLSLDAVFVNRGKDRFPKLDMDVVLGILGQSTELGLTSPSGTNAFLTLDGATYFVPQSGVRQYEQAEARDPDSGIHPLGWISNERDLGTVALDGVETRHVTADLDSARMLSDLDKSSKQSSGSVESFVEQARKALRPGTLELFIGKQDEVTRRAVVQVPFQAERPSGPPVTGNLNLRVDVTGVNKPQRIVTPKGARPYSELAGVFTSDKLSELFGRSIGRKLGRAFTGGSALGGAQGTPSARARSAGTQAPPAGAGAAPAVPSEAQPYLACVRRAPTAAELQRCASRLP
jgi:hypothetical protein